MMLPSEVVVLRVLVRMMVTRFSLFPPSLVQERCDTLLPVRRHDHPTRLQTSQRLAAETTPWHGTRRLTQLWNDPAVSHTLGAVCWGEGKLLINSKKKVMLMLQSWRNDQP